MYPLYQMKQKRKHTELGIENAILAQEYQK